MKFIILKMLKKRAVISAAFVLLLGLSGCDSLNKQDYTFEPLHIDDFTPFKAGREIERKNPSIEEIVLSMNFLQRDDPFELMRYWIGEGFNGVWKGEDWVDLFEGDGDCPPMAVEIIAHSDPLNVKVIVWIRKTQLGKSSPYLAPFLRHEYMLELEREGWRKKEKLIKLGPNLGDRVYPYDARTFKAVRQ